jgi:FHS family L-fucose permease-like MFS transporter
VGGAIIPPLYGNFVDNVGFKTALMFIILCYVYILWYGYKNSKKH